MKRNGFTIVEITAAIAVLGVVLGVGLQLMSTAAKAEARFHRRQVAIQELQNQLQSVEMLDWDELDDDAAKSLSLSDVAQKQLKSAEFAVSVHAKTDSKKFPESKQVILSITWQEPEKQKVTVRLSTWRFPKTELKKPSIEN